MTGNAQFWFAFCEMLRKSANSLKWKLNNHFGPIYHSPPPHVDIVIAHNKHFRRYERLQYSFLTGGPGRFVLATYSTHFTVFRLRHPRHVISAVQDVNTLYCAQL